MKRNTYLIFAILWCTLCAISFTCGLIWLDAKTTIFAFPIAILTATLGCADWCGWYYSKHNPQSPEKEKVLEMKKQIQAMPKTKPSKKLQILKKQVRELLDTPFKGKTRKQKYQRRGMDEALICVLELINDLENK